MPSITVTFKAKLTDFYGGNGYKVPELAAHHVHTEGNVGSMVSADIRNGRLGAVHWWLRRHLGYKLPMVVYAAPSELLEAERNDDSAQWRIKPIGNGFMAEVSRTFTA